MFRKIITALLLTGIILTTPAFIYAQNQVKVPETAVSGDSQGLNDAILKAKTIIGDTESYKSFNHNIYSYNGVTLYQLYWSDHKDGEPDIQMTVGSDGVVYNYNKNYVSSSSFVIPAVTKDDAINTAYNFVSKLNPEYINLISKNYATVEYNRYGTYSVNFCRVEKGVIVYNNRINVNLNGDGLITSYSSESMAKNVAQASAAARLTRSEILTSFKNNLPFETVYQTYYPENSDKASIRLVYRLNNNYSSTAVDAVTGKMYNLVYEDSDGNGISYPTASESAAQDSASKTPKNELNLSKAEKAAVELQKSFITVEDINAKIKAMPEFGGYNLNVVSSSIYKSESQYSDAVKYFWNVNYEFTDTQNNTGSAYVTVNAETGEIINFNCYKNNPGYKNASEYKYTDEDCRNAAEAFLVKYYSDKKSEYKPGVKSPVIPYDNMISFYDYSYNRYVNGILFDNDNINISVDPDTLAVTNFSINYSDDASFPSPDGIITPDAAVESYFGAVALNPYYLVTLGFDKDGSLIRVQNNLTAKNKQLTLVYSYTDYCFIDAFSGEAVDYSGKKYISQPANYYSPTSFGDISNSKYKDKIKKLSDMDVIKTDSRFFPTRPVTQSEYFEMLRYLNSSWYIIYTEYKVAAGNGGHPDDYFSINLDDIDENAKITRETAVKVIIDAMGYGNAARIKGIYKCPLSDADKISDDCYGYVTLAYGFGLIDFFGNTFNPQAILTREEAAALVYEYMIYVNQSDNLNFNKSGALNGKV